MRVLRSVTLAMMLVCCQTLGRATEPPGADAEAAHALEVVKKLITPENFKSYGLSSYEQVSALKLGRGIDAFYVFNDDLKSFNSAKPSGAFVTASQTKLYPVIVEGEGKLLITIRFREGRWRIASFGQSSEAYNLAHMMENLHQLDNQEKGPYVIEIPSFNLAYASLSVPNKDSDLTLLPLSPESLKVAKPGLWNQNLSTAAVSGIVNGNELFTILASEAQRLGEPPVTPR